MMKKAFLLTVTALAALLATSCQKDDLGRILTATIEQYEHNGGAKAYINNYNYACWENGDTVNINGVKYPISIPSGEGQPGTASILGTDNLTERPLLAYYPASGVSSWSDDNVTISLPQVQTYREINGHQVIDNPMAAYCPEGSNELKFRNLAALLKVTITAPSDHDLHINAILVKGDDGQKLWGTAPLTLNNQNQPILDKISGGSASVFLVFENPMVIGGGYSKSFYIVVPDGSSFKNFTIHVAATEQGIYKKVSKLGQSLPRNHIGALTYAPADNEKVNNVILYSGSIEGFEQNAFEPAAVTSNVDGVLLFDGPISSIMNRAFFRCSSLTSISLPAGVTSIGNWAFSGCSSLTSISLPAGVTSIGTEAFTDCRSLTSISLPADLTSIGNWAFAFCRGLTSISLPAGVTSIGTEAFIGCTNLATVYVNRWELHGTPKITPFGSSMFFTCLALRNIYVPSAAVDTYKDADGWREEPYRDMISAQ